MLISASYKTDIPTFYGQWFLNRLRAGYCKMVNPYNRQISRVSLERDAVDGFVFWTKNIGPFLKALAEVKIRGFPFVVQHTINGYPRELEQKVVSAERSAEHLRHVADAYGPSTCVWRYDTIILSSLTTADFHLKQFEKLAKALEGVTDEVVVSFVHLYAKTLRNMNEAAKRFSFSWNDPALEEKRTLARQLVEIAAGYGMQLTICSQREYLVEGAKDARCVDADRLERLGGRRISAALRGNRKECGCFASKDIGEYDTCPHGCVYCYAVMNQELAAQRYRSHDPESEFLFRPDFPISGQLAETEDQPSLFK